MRLSEAIRLGSLAIQNPRAGDTRYCAIGMGLRAIGKCELADVEDFQFGICDNYRANYDALAAAWPWVMETKKGSADYKTVLYTTFDDLVIRGRTMTLEALCDMVSGWERELESKGINVEQVTMAAGLNQPASQATENIPELDVKLEQDVVK